MTRNYEKELELFEKKQEEVLIDKKNRINSLKTPSKKAEYLYSNLLIMKGFKLTVHIRMVGHILSNQRKLDELLSMSSNLESTFTWEENSIIARKEQGTICFYPVGEKSDYDMQIDVVKNYQNLQHMSEFFENPYVALFLRKFFNNITPSKYVTYESKNSYSEFYGYLTENGACFTAETPEERYYDF